MIKITVKQLQQLNACQSGIDWFIKSKKKTLRSIIPALLVDNHAAYARWLLSRLMSKPQQIQWAIYCAELVISWFEKKYPNNDRPRKAIQAAKDFLAGKITKDAANAAAYAAYAAAYAAYAASAANAKKEINIKIMTYALKLLGEIK